MGWRSERSTYLVAAAWITISGRTSLKTSRIDSMFVTSIGSVRQPVNCCASILNLLFRPVSTTWLSLDSRIPKRLPRKPVPPVISILCFISEPFCESVEPEIRAPVGGFYECRLISLIQHARLQNQEIHLCSHETTVTIFRRTYDGLTTHIETGVYDQRAAGLPAKRIDDFPVKWINKRNILRLAIRREAHYLVFAAVDFEPGVVGERTVQKPETVRKAQLFQQSDLVAAARSNRTRRPFSHAID